MENQNKPKRIATIVNVLILIAAVAGIAWIASQFIHIGVEYTDNAQVRRNITPINSRVQGFIKEIRFNEFQNVKKGDTLVIIEDTEYRLRVLQAEASLQSARQNREAAGTTASTAKNNIHVSSAALAELEVLLGNARTEKERYEKLLAQGAVTRQQYDGVETHYDATLAKYNTMKQQRKSTTLVSDELALRLEQQNTLVELAETALELAGLNLSYTVITAPANGIMGRKNIQEGQLIQPGQAVGNIVEDDEIWITANYKETQIANIKEGSAVEITVDAVPDVTFKGIVRSISDATGAQFSLVPTDNSAGNFVKVQQRIPLRIEFTGENSTDDLARLRSGMNAECKIAY
ncbi:MAG: HlyD family secretion protein [Bacteroidaceae bacterium]|nr:HlyD family secretion protein [Bacteroidaceae bacterium]